MNRQQKKPTDQVLHCCSHHWEERPADHLQRWREDQTESNKANTCQQWDLSLHQSLPALSRWQSDLEFWGWAHLQVLECQGERNTVNTDLELCRGNRVSKWGLELLGPLCHDQERNMLMAAVSSINVRYSPKAPTLSQDLTLFSGLCGHCVHTAHW